MKIILVDAIHCLIYPGGEIFEEMKWLLDWYSNKKIILTGANPEQSKQHRLDQVPYELFTLSHNPEKTDPLYYATFLKEKNLTAWECVYFENSLEAVKSARSVGITTHHYDRELKDLVALQQFLDKELV
jgi:FMN phosphatase YigB (HAD superfamily)